MTEFPTITRDIFYKTLREHYAITVNHMPYFVMYDSEKNPFVISYIGDNFTLLCPDDDNIEVHPLHFIFRIDKLMTMVGFLEKKKLI